MIESTRRWHVRGAGVSGLLLALVLGCSSCKEEDKQAGKQAGEADASEKQAEKTEPIEGPPADEGEANFADPQVEPPPAPEGVVTLKDPWLYVQSCSEAQPCPELKQPAGDAHCRELMIGNADGWRLPSKDEVPRFQGVAGLEQTAGYHWTRTPFEDDMSQVWIVDPSGEGPATTIPRERKPFRVRCVKEP